jgi:hypothetical protein
MLPVGGWSHGHSSSSKFYWKSDVYAMAEMLGLYEKNLYMRKPGAKQALENFKVGRQAQVRTILEVDMFLFHSHDELTARAFSMWPGARTGCYRLLHYDQRRSGNGKRKDAQRELSDVSCLGCALQLN